LGTSEKRSPFVGSPACATFSIVTSSCIASPSALAIQHNARHCVHEGLPPPLPPPPPPAPAARATLEGGAPLPSPTPLGPAPAPPPPLAPPPAPPAPAPVQ